MADKVKVLVLFHTQTGNTAKLAKVIAEGISEEEGTEVAIKQVPGSKAEGIEIATQEDLVNADAVAVGTPTHFGSFAAELKTFIDQLTPNWLKGQLAGKPVALFCSAGSMHGGEEATLISTMIPFFNLGMIPVGIPYPIAGESPDFDSGSPYGAIFVSGHRNENELKEADKKVAKLLGKRLTAMAHLMNCGCESCTPYRGQIRDHTA